MLSGLMGGKKKPAPIIDKNSRAYKQFQSNVGRMLKDVDANSEKRLRAQSLNPPMDMDWRKDPQAVAGRMASSSKARKMGTPRAPASITQQGGMQTLNDVWAEVKPPTGNVSSANDSPTYRAGLGIGYAEEGEWKKSPFFGGMDPNRQFGSSKWADYSRGSTVESALRGNLTENLRRRAREMKSGKGPGFRTQSKSNPGWAGYSRGWAGSGWSSGDE